ncbi:unnamed protein product [Orchesella dallaii]|uniref:Uncharacterized protein n=1 Tax=Orchesella dallaii TaxID=48710 RepID=A0ABP1RHX4_9HEXA
MLPHKSQERKLARLFQGESDEDDKTDNEDYDLFASQNAQRMDISQPPPPNHPANSASNIQLEASSSTASSLERQRMNENVSLLLEIDPDKNLSIWEYLEQENRDPLIKEYIDIVRDSNFLPEEPMSDLLRDSDFTPSFELAQDIQCKVINNFSCYLKGDNFVTNVKGATEANITLFQPTTKFYIPQYSLLPGKVFETFDNCKKMCVLSMQSAAVLGQSFTKELLLLRNFKLLKDAVALQLGDEDERLETTKYFYLTLYTSTYVNYFKTKKVKNIVWSQRKGRTHGSVPKWRMNNSEPPTETKCKFAEKLTSLVTQNKIKIDKVKALGDLDKFQAEVRKFNTDNSNRNSNNSEDFVLSQKRKPKLRPNGPKQVRKLTKVKPRQKNPLYDQNRILDSDNDVELDQIVDTHVENALGK